MELTNAMTKEEALDFFAALFYGEHHIPSEVKECGYGWQISSNYTRLATFDYNDLTRLVVLAHDRCIRAEVYSRGMNRTVIQIHKRQRNDSLTKGHPSIEEHIKSIRENKWYNHKHND